MAIKIVTFEDKQNLTTNENIPRINKVTDDDINQLKDVANTNANGIGDLSLLLDFASLVEAINTLPKITETNNGLNIKFANGLMIEVIKQSYSNVACNSGWGGLYGSGTRSFPDYSESFIEEPYVIATNKSTTGNHWIYRPEGTSDASGAGNYALLRPTQSNVSGYVVLVAIGKYK